MTNQGVERLQPNLIALDALNALSVKAFKAVLAPIFENAPWVVDVVVDERPFASLTALHKAMMARVASLPEDSILAFLRGHARLSPETLRRGTTAESKAEQASAGLDALDEGTTARLGALNTAYETRFGFPFILAIRHASRATLFATFERRISASPAAERAEAMEEIAAISWMRLLDRVRPAPTGGLSTHVLDTARAVPAAGLGVELWRQENGIMTRLETLTTDANGACEVDPSATSHLRAATYEWRYDTSTYFARSGYSTPSRNFLGKINVAFSVWNPEEHFHVPLLLTPGSYTAYRGG